MQFMLCGCGGYYQNSTAVGSTVADDGEIRSITKAATVLATLPEGQLSALARDTAAASLQYAGLKRVDTSSFSFACWLPCTREPRILEAAGDRVMTLTRIQGPTPAGGEVQERWIFDDRGETKVFLVAFTYSLGGRSGVYRKPDLVRIRPL
jgi:hypothetical protein